MKRCLILLLLLSLSLVLVACNSQSSKSKIQYNTKYYMQRNIDDHRINMSHAYIVFHDDKTGEVYQYSVDSWGYSIELVHFKNKFTYEYIDTNVIIVVTNGNDIEYLEGHNIHESTSGISIMKLEVYENFLSVYDEIFVSEKYLLEQGLITTAIPQTLELYRLRTYEHTLYEIGAFIITDRFKLEQYIFQRTLTTYEIEPIYSTFLDNGGIYIILHLDTTLDVNIRVSEYTLENGVLKLELSTDPKLSKTPYNMIVLDFLVVDKVTSVDYKIVS